MGCLKGKDSCKPKEAAVKCKKCGALAKEKSKVCRPVAVEESVTAAEATKVALVRKRVKPEAAKCPVPSDGCRCPEAADGTVLCRNKSAKEPKEHGKSHQKEHHKGHHKEHHHKDHHDHHEHHKHHDDDSHGKKHARRDKVAPLPAVASAADEPSADAFGAEGVLLQTMREMVTAPKKKDVKGKKDIKQKKTASAGKLKK